MMTVALAGAVAPQAAGATAVQADPAQICERVAAFAARESGVPYAVLLAVSLTETGRRAQGAFRPWPWTVNMEGEGHWFQSDDAARAYVFREFKRGARSFDVGCFQINYKWHGAAFASLDQMFDPVVNARYAARLLGDLYRETGSWGAAAGAYHSRTPEHAGRYQARFERILAGLTGTDAGLDPGGSPDPAGTPVPALAAAAGGDIPEIPDIVAALGGEPAAAPRPRVNTFPLLVAGSGGSFGSLVQLDSLPATPIFADGRDPAEGSHAGQTPGPEELPLP
jgi:hypothetical protein